MKKGNFIILGIILTTTVLAGGVFWYNKYQNNNKVIKATEKECVACIKQGLSIKQCKYRGYCEKPEEEYLEIKKEADKKIKEMLAKTTVYIRPPEQLTSKDFPEHNIDIKKYFTPVPFIYDPEIKVKKRFFDAYYIENETDENVREAGEYAHSYTTIRLQKMCDEGKISKEVCEKDDPWLEGCYSEVSSLITHLKRDICRGEKIEGRCGAICIKNLKSKNKEELTYLEKGILEAHEQNRRTIYDSCDLPDEVMYQIFIKEYDEKNKCFDRWLERLEKNNYL